MAAPAKRITLKHGRDNSALILCEGPIPEVGDVCTIRGVDWTVSKVEDEKVLVRLRPFSGKLKQVFP